MNQDIYFHGTNKNFESFNTKRVFFSKDINVAESYSKKGVSFENGSSIIPVKLNINNPMKINANSNHWRGVVLGDEQGNKIYDQLLAIGFDCFSKNDICKDVHSTNDLCFYAEKLGYDSIIIENVIDYGSDVENMIPVTVVSVFGDSQITNAITNEKM